MAPKRQPKIVNPPPYDVLSLFPRLSMAIELEASTNVWGAPKDTKEYAKKLISLLGKEKSRELEEGWKVVDLMEYKFNAKRSEMIFKQNQATLDAAAMAENVLVSDSSSNVGDNDSSSSG